jgi:NADH:ubiquinone reductase (H+-translocating)
MSSDRTTQRRPHVVIVGCGFGGLAAARSLADIAVDVTVIDRRNHHLFQPLLYQVATAGLNPADIAQPIRRILRDQANCRVLLDEVIGVDLESSSVLTPSRPLEFDYLVLATGATHSYFGHDSWARHAPGLKTIEDALDIRRRILLAFERAEAADDDPTERQRQMTFVVVGAGPTGVELAGAVREIATRTLRSDFRSIDTTESTVMLVEAGPRVLSAFVPKLSDSARRQLVGLGVVVRTDATVTAIDATGVTLGNEIIPAATVLWGAGVAASPLGRMLPAATDRSGRVEVLGDLSIEGYPNVFVIGDLASTTDAHGHAVPGVAPAAQQGGRHVGRSIAADLAGTQRPPFEYRDKGSLATVGRSRAVADLGHGLRFSGYFAWVVWWLVHIWSLIDFHSRLQAMMSWAWQYLTGTRNSRLITGDLNVDLPAESGEQQAGTG